MKTIQRISFDNVTNVLTPLILSLIFIVTGIASIQYLSRTRDEARHLVRGVMLLETGDYRLNKHHPVLANVLNALPTIFIADMQIPSTTSDTWEKAAKDEIAAEFVTINDGSRRFVPLILNPARIVTIVAVGLSVIPLFFFIKKEWGGVTAVGFSILYAFCPNLLAHGTLVTTDAWVVPMIFGATLAFYSYAKHPSVFRLTAFVLIAFCAIATKYSAVPVAFVWLLLLLYIQVRQQPTETKRIKIFLKSCLLPVGVVTVWAVLLTAAYGFRFRTLADTNYDNTNKTEESLDNISLFISNDALASLAKNAYLHLRLPFPEYIQGFYENVLVHDVYGHDSFLFGMYAKKGWWYYFPLAMLVKMPVPALIGIAGLAALSAKQTVASIQTAVRKKVFPRYSFEPYHILLFVPLFFFLLSMKSSINLGIRHILPVFPFIYLGIGQLSSKLWHLPATTNRILATTFWRSTARFTQAPWLSGLWNLRYHLVIVALGIWYVASSPSIYPHYLEYFNELAGGPENGYRYLLDSNLSWAQDKFYLEDYIYSVPGNIDVYVNPLAEVENGIVVMDVDLLMGRDSSKRDKTAWLREPLLAGDIEPIDRINYTHLVFDL